ncbi:ADP-ribose pyrophosphatase [Alicyclobacillus cellulosilyticus]|uniref:ADP-ribose pyrophosphatase n=1 Tax=Alicyclobacillus cellulosilyticus TaxID=1003997 RepID=A0A917K3H7_9BACL|nr:NUDIX hydrolase [Alicyclobacillus cellulosilyticus]GGI95641.1 ADP-ribose pyrophosphatase [Alicyclobacillus cellulosilyticus]
MSPHRFYERTVGTETLFSGRVVRLERLTVELPDGSRSTREVVRHPGAVAVLAEPRPGYLLLVEQYRKGPEQALLEIPAGKLDPGESPERCALRELAEETGYQAAGVAKVCEFFSTPGFSDEKVHLFVASGLVPGRSHPDADEWLAVHELPQQEVARKLWSGELRDAKTIIAVQWWLLRANGGADGGGCR